MAPRVPLRYFLFLAAVVTLAFGAYYVVWGALALQRGNAGFALFYGVYGLGGVALGVALARVWWQAHRARR